MATEQNWQKQKLSWLRTEVRMENSENLIMIAVGPDRVGLVEKISEFIVERGCNIEDSRMAAFAGEFAVILLISGEARNLSKISQSSADLSEQTGLQISVKQPSRKKPQEPSLPYKLIASCMDHPGVVYKISTTLSKLGINIESLETDTYPAPVSGTPIFRMEAIISIPTRLNINTVRSQFDGIEREENIDIDLNLVGSAE
jgi:glycine cleavage system transcriptional repressor